MIQKMFSGNRFSWSWFLFCFLAALPASAESWKEQAAAWLTYGPVVDVLVVVGIVALGTSVVVMGTGIPEAITGVSFLLLFGGRYLAGEDPWVPLALLIIGGLGIAVEVFIMPGFGVPGLVGLTSLGAFAVLITGDMKTGLTLLTGSLFASTFGCVFLIKVLGMSPTFRKFAVLEPPKPEERPSTPDHGIEVGSVGSAKSNLRPAGIAEIDGKRVDVVSEGSFIPRETLVEVIEVDGDRVVVRATPD